jgi:nucleotidyltransferase/DNA polymerase involved in DNA repair
LRDRSISTRPVAVVHSTPEGQILGEVSNEAAADGLSAGLCLREARLRCPSLISIQHSPHRVARAHACLWSAVSRSAPAWEAAGPGRVFADFTGTARLFGGGAGVTRRVAAGVTDRYGFSVAAAVGTNKLVAHIAAGVAETASPSEVRPGEEREFVAPFAPAVLPQAAWPSWRPLFRVLDDLNLRRLGTVAAVPVEHLRAALGPPALALHECASGRDDRAVGPTVRQPSVTLVRSLGDGTVDSACLTGVLFSMLEQLCRGLRREGRVCSSLRVTVTYGDYAEAVSRFTPPRPSQWEHDLSHAIGRAVERAASRRVRVCSLTLEARATAGEPAQLSLLESRIPGTEVWPNRGMGPSDERRALWRAVDAIRDRFGEPAITWGNVRGRHDGVPA